MIRDSAEAIKASVHRVVSLLVSRDYRGIVQLAGGRNLYTEKHIRDLHETIEQYDRKIVAPPVDGYDRMEVIEVQNSSPRQWIVDMPLWTAEDGLSDLWLTLRLTERENDLEIELYGVRPQ